MASALDDPSAIVAFRRPDGSWIDSAGLHYFQSRVSLARRDVEFSLAVTLDQFTTRAAQERALEILQFKLDVLWQMNDAMAQRYGVQS